MKKYKPLYGFQFILEFIYVLFLIPFGAIPSFIFFMFAYSNDLGSVFNIVLYYIIFAFFFTLIMLCIGFIINLISKIFTKDIAYLYQDYFEANNKKIEYKEVILIQFDFGEIQRYGGSTPSSLYIKSNDDQFTFIERPSLPLIMNLKKRCSFAYFDINNKDSILKKQPFYAFLIGILLLVIVLISTYFNN